MLKFRRPTRKGGFQAKTTNPICHQCQLPNIERLKRIAPSGGRTRDAITRTDPTVSIGTIRPKAAAAKSMPIFVTIPLYAICQP